MVSQGPLNPASYKHSTLLNGVICLSVAGEIDLANAPEFSAQLKVAMESDGRGLILDLRELWYIDSSGIKSIFNARQSGRRIVLAGVAPHVKRILTIAGLHELVRMFPTIEEAVSALG